MLIAHLSDPHLTTGLLAAGPAEGLSRALGRVLAIEPRPDCVVVTGDLAELGTAEEYAAFGAILDRCPVPVHVTTGNHDDAAALVEAFGGTERLGGTHAARYAVDYPEATIVALDSAVPGQAGGRLGSRQLEWLDATLAARPDVPAFVALHHPPVAVGIQFLDDMRLEDGPALARVLARHPHVARVLAGHVHRTVVAPFASTLLTVAPSTYRQSHLRLHDAAPPGYLAEPTGMLLHIVDGPDCVTHAVAVSHAGAPLGF